MTDSRGWGLQAGLSGAFGYAGKRSAIVETIGFQGGQRMQAGLAVGFDYVRLPARTLSRMFDGEGRSP